LKNKIRVAKVNVPFSYGNESPLVSTSCGGLPFRTRLDQEVRVVRVAGRGQVMVEIEGCDQVLTVPKTLLNKSDKWTEAAG
jgi:hypothetical protein